METGRDNVKFVIEYTHADVKLLHGGIGCGIISAPCFCKSWIRAAAVSYAASVDGGHGEVANVAVAIIIAATAAARFVEIK